MLSQRQLFQTHLAQTSPSPLGLEIKKASGVFLFDTQGKKYIDLISGISVSNTGHSHPKIVEAVKSQAEKYMHLMVYGEYVQSPQVKYAEALAKFLPASLDCVYFTNSGTEAVEGALKLAKRHSGRTEIIAFKNAYHGSTHGALSVMGNEVFKRAFRPLLPSVKFCSFNSIDDLKLITEKTACVITEPIQGEAGIILPANDYLKELRKRCDETGTLLILDEIQTGFGRTGKLFAFEHYGMVPDILLSAKALGGGMPLGAFISSQKIMSSLSSDPVLGHITTFGGHPVCCAAGLAAFNVLHDEKLIEQVSFKESLFKKYLIHPLIKSFRSKGLLIAIEMENEEINKKVIAKCIEYGVITDWFLFCDYSMRIAPPLSISEEEIKMACEAILKAME